MGIYYVDIELVRIEPACDGSATGVVDSGLRRGYDPRSNANTYGNAGANCHTFADDDAHGNPSADG